jgi:hypothetical protein
MADNYESVGLQVVSVYEVTQRFENGTWVNYDPNPAVYGITNPTQADTNYYNDRYISENLNYDYGLLDGKNAYLNAISNSVQQPANSAIYFAIDGDVHSYNLSYVIDYFSGVKDAFSQLSGGKPIYTIGVYGSGYVLDQISPTYAQYRWLAAAGMWNGSPGYQNYDIKQLSQATDNGHAYDPDLISDSTFGQWSSNSSPFVGPEITVTWGTAGIADDGTTPSAGDGTDFGIATQGGTSVQRAFTVINSGDSILTLGAVDLPSGFTLVEGLATSIAPGNFDTFTVQLDTAMIGAKSGQIAFTTNDPDENPFVFTIAGTVNPSISVADSNQGYAGNFNGNDDSHSDLLWRSDTGALSLWEMNGTSKIGGGNIAPIANNWQIAGLSDFNHDGRSDILWRNDNGTVALWEMNGANKIGGGNIGAVTADWHIAGTGDFNHDGNSDVLWRNDNGTVSIWAMNGVGVIAGGNVAQVTTDWHIVGVGDFNGDTRSDILWRNDNGVVSVWMMNGTSVSAGGNIAPVTTNWHVVGVGDFNGDTKSDILWRNDNGALAIWEMNGTTMVGGGNVTTVATNWHVVGTGDFNGDGKSDIEWRNDAGVLAIWEMNGTSVVASGNVTTTTLAWNTQAHHYDLV